MILPNVIVEINERGVRMVDAKQLNLLCGLHKVCSHITARSDLFICP